MVTGRRRARLGGSTLGCVISLVFFAAAVYYGVHIGEVYLRYYQLLDAMRGQAELAPSLDDGVIARRLAARADTLFPGRAPRFRIRRGGNPLRIIIQTEYHEELDLPFVKHTMVLRPRVEERL